MIKEKKKCTKLSKNKKNIEINFLPHEEIFYEKKKMDCFLLQTQNV